MPLAVPNTGEVRLLEIIVGKSTLAGTPPASPGDELILHLYVNQVNLADETFTADSFTEASASGYSSATLTGSNWTASTDAGTGVSTAVYSSNITFTFSVGEDVYGYYVTNNAGQILWAEEFPSAPFALPSTGGEISIKPQVQLS